MKTLTIPEIACFFKANDHFLILTHRRPDGDTLGCAAALCRGLLRLRFSCRGLSALRRRCYSAALTCCRLFFRHTVSDTGGSHL